MTLLLILVLGSVAWYLMDPDERTKLLRTAKDVIAEARRLAIWWGTGRGPFERALRERTRWAVVTPALAFLNIMVFLQMLVGPGALGDPATLVAWGANFGPETSNGGWSRLVTSLFVHSGPLHLLVSVLALLQVGFILERLVGPFAFAVVYLATGVSAGVVSLYAHPVSVSAGASGAVFGIYGLLLAGSIRGLLRRSAVTIPLTSVKTLGPMAAVFVLYSAADGIVHSTAEWAACAVGFAAGLVLTKDVEARKPPLQRVMAAAAAALVITVASAVPIRGIANVRPELDRLVEMETRLAGAYGKVVRQFTAGAVTAKHLVQVIDRTIRPELKAAQARFHALTGVPSEQQALVAGAEEYLRLRDESWRMRAEALHKADMPGLRAADRREWASLQALARITDPTDRPAGH